MKLLENWKIPLVFLAVLGVIALVSLTFYPLDYVDPSANDNWGFFDFSGLETETQTPSTPEQLEAKIFLDRAKENMMPMALCCTIVLSGMELYSRSKKSG